MNLVMFGSPDGHRKALDHDSIRVDHRVIRTERRGNQIDRIDHERNGYTIFSTLMLAVDISFLAILFVQAECLQSLYFICMASIPRARWWLHQSFARRVNDSQQYPTRRSALQSFDSYSLSCSPDPMLEMLHSGERLRLECLALMLSLPIAFLILGCVSH
ncbi:hypothetical protein EDD22DRAFT_1049636, partial [Suillus occidentalis]